MYKNEIYRYIIIFYIIILLFVIGMIIRKFTVIDTRSFSSRVSIDINVSDNISPEKLVNRISKWMELDIESSRSIIADGIPTIAKKETEGIINKVIKPDKWIASIISWTIGINLEEPDTYFYSSIPCLNEYLKMSSNVMAAVNKTNLTPGGKEDINLYKPKVIKSEKGSIYLNVPRESLINYGVKKDTIDDSKKPPTEFQEFIDIRPRVLIYHTHGSETYIDDTNPQDNLFHVLLPNMGQIIQVGKIISDELKKEEIEVFHDTTSYDGEKFNEAYHRARKAISALLKERNFDIVLDIHRDAVSETDFSRDNFVVEIDGKPAARVLLLFTQGNLEYSNKSWKANQQFCTALAEKMQQLYPGLLRRIEPREGRRYNQDLHPHSILIEIGCQKNTITEAIYTGKLLAKVIAELLKKEPGFLLDNIKNQ